VLFDRYTLDGAVPSGMRLSLAGRLSRRVQRYACPMPDMVLLLDASGELLHARSAEYDAATLESWMVAYRRLQGSVPGLERIDAERSADEVARQAESLIWQRYRERHGAARGG
jgi:thymidylate kinase